MRTNTGSFPENKDVGITAVTTELSAGTGSTSFLLEASLMIMYGRVLTVRTATLEPRLSVLASVLVSFHACDKYADQRN